MAFIKFLFYFFLIIFVLRILFRIFFPILLKYLVKKYSGGASFSWTNAPQEPKQEEGKVTINSKPSQKEKIVEKGEGDYVDYVEIK